MTSVSSSDAPATAPAPVPTAAAPLVVRNPNDRLRLPLAYRLPLATFLGGFSGFMLGATKGSQDAGLRFRAENAHRLPSSQTGWYFYHKSKNYNIALGGIVEGVKQSVKFGAWAGLYFVIEEGIDRGRSAVVRQVHGFRDELARKSKGLPGRQDAEWRQLNGNRDFMSSVLAGLGTAGIFSAWNRFPLPTAARTATMGAKAGLVFGLIQDALSLARGNKVGYVEFIKRHTIGTSDQVRHEIRSAG